MCSRATAPCAGELGDANWEGRLALGAPTPRCQMGGGDRPLRGEDPPFGKDTWISRTANSGQESSCAHWPLQGRAVFLRPPATRRPLHEGSGTTPLQSAFGEPVCPRGRWDTAWRAAAPFSPWAVSPRLRPGSGLLHLLRTRRPLALLPSGCPRGRAPLPPRRPAAEAACAREPHPGRCDLPPHGASHRDASARRWALSRGPAGRLRA